MPKNLDQITGAIRRIVPAALDANLPERQGSLAAGVNEINTLTHQALIKLGLEWHHLDNYPSLETYRHLVKNGVALELEELRYARLSMLGELGYDIHRPTELVPTGEDVPRTRHHNEFSCSIDAYLGVFSRVVDFKDTYLEQVRLFKVIRDIYFKKSPYRSGIVPLDELARTFNAPEMHEFAGRKLGAIALGAVTMAELWDVIEAIRKRKPEALVYTVFSVGAPIAGTAKAIHHTHLHSRQGLDGYIRTYDPKYNRQVTDLGTFNIAWARSGFRANLFIDFGE